MKWSMQKLNAKKSVPGNLFGDGGNGNPLIAVRKPSTPWKTAQYAISWQEEGQTTDILLYSYSEWIVQENSA